MISLDLIRGWAARQPDKTAISDGDESLTWAQLAAQTESVRAWLTRTLRAGESGRAVVIAPNSVRFAVVAAALTSLTVPWVGIDPARDAETIAEQTKAVDPTLLVIDSSVPGLPAALAPWLGVVPALDLVGFPGFDTRFTHYIAVAAGGEPAADWQQPPFLALGFTSGSTGTPKLFVRRRKTENQRVRFLLDRLAFGPDDTFLITSPLAFASGHVWVSAALTLGGSVRLGPGDGAQALAVAAAEKVTGAFFVPPFLDRFLELATTTHADADLSSLRFVLTGGRHVSPRTIRQCAQRLGDVLYVYYATTETGINTMAGPQDLAAQPYCAGACMPGVTVRALDPGDLRPLPEGMTGQLAIESAYAMDDYVHQRLETVDIDGHRYILTSDYGYLDDDRVFVTARAHGQVSAAQARLNVVRCEGAVKNDPDISDVCVLPGLDDAQSDAARSPVETAAPSRPIAVVVLREGLSDASRQEALDRVRVTLAPLCGDVHVVEGERIPYNSAGKVALVELRELLASR